MMQLITSSTRTALGVRRVARLPHSQHQRATASSSKRRPRGATTTRLQSTTTTPPSRRQQSTAFMSDTAAAATNEAPMTMEAARTSWMQRFRDSLNAVLLKPRTVSIPRWISPQHYTITLSECFGHSSFILVAASYAVDDFLHLRIIAVAGSTAMLFFTYFHPHGRVLWLPFKWNVLFIMINSYRIGKVYMDRFMAQKLDEDLLRVREDHFSVVDPIDFARLVRSGRVVHYSPGDLIVGQGTPNRYIRLVVTGDLMAVRDGVPTYHLEEGSFVSEAGLHAGLMLRGKVESCCAIVANEPSKVIMWERSELMDLLQREKMLRRSLKAALSWDIVRKLKGQREMLALRKIADPELWTQKRNEQNHHRYASILQNMLRHPQYLQQRKDELVKYRMIHHIDDEHHRMALERCGWTPEEFEAGFKEGELDEEQEEVHRGWKWLAHDMYLRIFG